MLEKRDDGPRQPIGYGRNRLVALHPPARASVGKADFKKLHVWEKAHALSLTAHRVAQTIRGAEYTSLKSQMIRSAMSIPANLVEGRGQKTAREFSRYVRVSIGSASELEYHLITARDFGAITHSDFLALLSQLIEVRRMLYGLLHRLVAP